MAPSIQEIILLVVICLCIFGLGRLGAISEAIGEMRARRVRGAAGRRTIDITPERDEGAEALKTPSHMRVETVDEAIIERDGDVDEDSQKPSNS
jgi:Sec-independent protein translocase protein TatA